MLTLSVRHLLVIDVADTDGGDRIADYDLSTFLVLQVGAVCTLAVVDGHDALAIDLGVGAVVPICLCLYFLLGVHWGRALMNCMGVGSVMCV